MARRCQSSLDPLTAFAAIGPAVHVARHRLEELADFGIAGKHLALLGDLDGQTIAWTARLVGRTM
jgi:hypothetical protein